MRSSSDYPYGIVNNIEFLDPNPMNMRCASCELYIEIDRDTKECYASDYIALKICPTTRGKLKQVNPALGKKIEKYFNINLQEYDVAIVATEDITITKDDIYF